MNSNVLRFFPFMGEASWFERYWYEREAVPIRKLVSRLLLLRPGNHLTRRRGVGETLGRAALAEDGLLKQVCRADVETNCSQIRESGNV